MALILKAGDDALGEADAVVELAQGLAVQGAFEPRSRQRMLQRVAACHLPSADNGRGDAAQAADEQFRPGQSFREPV